MPEYDTFQTTWNNTETIFAQNLTDLTDGADSDKPIALFCITFTEASRTKLEGGQRLYISYQTLLDRLGVTDGNLVKIDNVGSIFGHTVQTGLETAFHQQLNKQVSKTGIAPSGDDFVLDSDVYVDGPVDIDLGDTGGRIYYRILFYNYGDVIEFHDDLLQEFDGKIGFDQNMRIYDAATGEIIGTAKIWGQHIDSSGKYYGNYKLYDLDEYQDCIIGLYYSIDVSGDRGAGGFGRRRNPYLHQYRGMDGRRRGFLHRPRRPAASPTLKKDGVLTTENGENLVYYYVAINPDGRDLHPTSNLLELRDSLTLPVGASAALRPETIGLYHYDPGNAAGTLLRRRSDGGGVRQV